MSGFVVPRPSSYIHFIMGSVIVLAFQLLTLAPFNLEIVGQVWPVAIIWAIGGWAIIGPDYKIGAIVFFLGLTMDVISGISLGTYALLYLFCYAGVLLKFKFITIAPHGSFGEGALIGIIYILASILAGILTGNIPNIFQIIIPCCSAVILYRFMVKFFIITKDVT